MSTRKHLPYTGPAKPIPTHRIHPVDNRVSKGLFLVFLISILLMDLLVWRPN
jgi:hypothetical protein